MSQGMVVRCPSCAARLRLPAGDELPERFRVRCSECGNPFAVRRRAEPAASATGASAVTRPPLVEPAAPSATLQSRLEEEATRRTPAVGALGTSRHGDSASTARDVAAPRPLGESARSISAPQPFGGSSLLGGATAGTLGHAGGRAGDRAGRTFAAGELVAGRYRIERFIAQGGMGEVYEAHDLALGEPVALKTVRPDVAADELALERFKREIQLARQVTHRNVCRIHDLGAHRTDAAGSYATGEIPFVSMELLRGETLSDRLARGGPLSEEEAWPLVRQMAAALQAAHAVGIVHRDFKCANVVLEPDEEGGRVVVTDFGLARGRQGAETAATLTVAGAVMGSPGYMAPEQVEGGKVTPAVDVYALGVVLFEMLTGRLPFKGETPIATAVKRLTDAPPKPTSLRADVSPRWEEAILRCLARRPEERFQSAAEVVAALDPAPVAAQAAEGAPRLARRRIVLAVAAGFLVALALALNFVVWRDRAAREGGALEAPARARRSVALLALRNVTGDERLAWLSHGLPEMLSSELAAGGAVRLVPGENVIRAQRELGLEPGGTWGADTLERVRRNLGSDYLVTGAFTALDGPTGPLRLDLRLQDTLAGGSSTAVAVNGSRDAVFDLVAEAGERLREALDLRGGGGGAWRSTDPEALRLYSEGLEKLRNFDALGARRLFEEAVALDPDDARLHSALARSLAALGYHGKAKEAARRAVDLSGSLEEVERQEIRAQYLEVAGDWAGAAAAWEALWRGQPDDLEYGLELAAALIAAGDAQRALDITSVLRKLPSAAAGDLRIHVAEAAAAGALGDSRRQQQAAHEAAAAAGEQGARLQRAVALLQEGWALRNLGEGGRARAVTAEAERLFEEAGDLSGVARARVQRASLLYDQGELETARGLFEQALDTYRERGDKGGQAQALNNLAVVVKQQGEAERALGLYVESRRISEEAGSEVGVANAENNIGTIRLKRGDLAGALASFQRALDLARKVGDRNLQAYALYNLAGTLRRQGRLAEAERRHREALELRRAIGQRIGEVASLTDLAAVHWDRGDLAAARTGYEQALALARETRNRRFEAYALAGLGQVRYAAGELAEAERLHREALAVREELGEQATAAESRLQLALVALEQGRFEDAEELARAAEERLAAEEFTDLVSAARGARARALAGLRRAEEAREAARLAGESGAASQDVRVRCDVQLARARVAAAEGRVAEARELAEEAAGTAERAGLLLPHLDGRLLLGQLAGRAGDGARGAQLVADARARAERSGLGLLTRRAATGG